jgi:hypothetical protein
MSGLTQELGKKPLERAGTALGAGAPLGLDPITSSLAGRGVGRTLEEAVNPALPALPGIPSPTVMPVPDDLTMRRARRRSLLQQMMRSGRQATMLTDTLG